MSAIDSKVGTCLISFAVPPVQETIVLGEDSCLHYGTRQATPYRIREIAGATRGVAVRHYTGAVLANDPEADLFGGMQDSAVCHHPFQGCSQRYNRRDVTGALAGHGMRHNPAQAMTYQMNLAARLCQCGIDGLVQLLLNKEVWAVRVEAYA